MPIKSEKNLCMQNKKSTCVLFSMRKALHVIIVFYSCLLNLYFRIQNFGKFKFMNSQKSIFLVVKSKSTRFVAVDTLLQY